jgi:hypothetical protein
MPRKKNTDTASDAVNYVEEWLSDHTPEPPKKAAPMPIFTFDRYFASLGKPAHWRAGMRAWLSNSAAKGKRTVAEWNRLFKDY